MSLLDIKNLSVRFGDTTAVPVVDGLDLSVDKGEVLAIVGESGSGKSVTMMALMGLIDAPAGVRRSPALRRPRHAHPQGPPAPAHRRQGHGDGLPGPDDRPQPQLHRRLPDRGSPPPASRPARQGPAPARPGTARTGRDPGRRQPSRRLPAPALRRHEPARGDRHGHRCRASC